jgi:hypothetical protein
MFTVSPKCETNLYDLSRQDIETICFFLFNRTEFSYKRKVLRHHIDHIKQMVNRIRGGEVIKRGILKNVAYCDARLYLLSKQCEYRDISVRRSSYARKTTKTLRQLLAKHKMRVFFDADNLVRSVISNDKRIVLTYKDIERIAKDYEFHKALFGS